MCELRRLPCLLQGGAVQVEPGLESTWFQTLKLKYDTPLSNVAFTVSNVAFNFNLLRPYTEVCARCHKVAYCSPECQKLHWKTSMDPHKDHCHRGGGSAAA